MNQLELIQFVYRHRISPVVCEWSDATNVDGFSADPQRSSVPPTLCTCVQRICIDLVSAADVCVCHNHVHGPTLTVKRPGAFCRTPT
jgi:hypothetical protein